MRLQKCAAAMAAAGIFVSATAGSAGYSIDAHVIAAGTSVHSASACYRLDATVGEPVAGFSASLYFALSAGFNSVAPSARTDDIFFSSFENCTP